MSRKPKPGQTGFLADVKHDPDGMIISATTSLKTEYNCANEREWESVAQTTSPVALSPKEAKMRCNPIPTFTPNQEQTFWDRVDVPAQPSCCWLWHGLTGRDGYGRFSTNGREFCAHRVAYALLIGDLSESLTIDHLCRNKKCVNPDHLEQVTAGDNSHRSPRGRKPNQPSSNSGKRLDYHHLWDAESISLLSHATHVVVPTLGDVRIPDNHPILAMGSAQFGDGPDQYPGFDEYCDRISDVRRSIAIEHLSRHDKATLWNQTFEADGGSQIAWDEDAGQYMTRSGDPYDEADVDATVKGLIK